MTNEELAILIQQGNKEPCTQLWERVRKLIVMLIEKYTKNWVLPNDIDKEDLLQCGYFVMLAAVKAYDPNKKYKFSSYLSYHVRNIVNRTVTNGRNTDTNVKIISCNMTVSGNDGDETELLELIPDKNTLYDYEQLEATEIQRLVWQAVSDLPQRQREVIQRYYLKNESLSDIARYKGTSVENIRVIKEQGLKLLRQNRALKAFYREYSSEPFVFTPFYLSYWKTSPERYAVEMDIYNRRQAGEYISYGKEQVILDKAKAEYLPESVKLSKPQNDGQALKRHQPRHYSC